MEDALLLPRGKTPRNKKKGTPDPSLYDKKTPSTKKKTKEKLKGMLRTREGKRKRILFLSSKENREKKRDFPFRSFLVFFLVFHEQVF